MGFLSASTSVVRFVAAAPSRLERERIAQAVSRHAFRDSEPGSGEARQASGQAWGWIAMHDPLQTQFTPADLFFHHYLVLAFRFDKRLVPPTLLSLERRRLENDRKTARGVERLGAAERREIKDEIAARLAAQALPTPRLFDVVWNLASGRVYFSGKLRAAREAFTDCFRLTFAITPVPLIPYLAAEHLGLGSGTVAAVRGVEPSNLVAAAGRADTATPFDDRPAPAPAAADDGQRALALDGEGL